MENFYPKKIRRVEWGWDGEAECRIEPGAANSQDGKSFQQETRLTLSRPGDPEDEYICWVGHATLETPIQSSSACRRRPPAMGKISQPLVLVPGQPATLRCMITGFYPSQLAVTWLRKGAGDKKPRCLQGSDTHSIHTPEPSRVPDGKSYSVESELHFTPAGPEDNGVEYQCQVQHETLQQPKCRSTGQLQLQDPRGPAVMPGR
ncbi:hypothetical protein Y1Q_0004966 [Alligator mississippiensis]|uniref:Ig-like domain-containing protein n=1 Tax=Alligator mississippiensis TaxID=8496 RepID=A0A151MYD9_ALLMI|nr:hypothetical protein Y1Q_0004966 [Alligator mississippiensis]